MVGIQAWIGQGDISCSLQLPEAGSCLSIYPDGVTDTFLGYGSIPAGQMDGGGSWAQRAQVRGRLLRWSVRWGSTGLGKASWLMQPWPPLLGKAERGLGSPALTFALQRKWGTLQDSGISGHILGVSARSKHM